MKCLVNVWHLQKCHLNEMHHKPPSGSFDVPTCCICVSPFPCSGVAPLSGGLYLQGPLGLNTQVCQPCSCVKEFDVPTCCICVSPFPCSRVAPLSGGLYLQGPLGLNTQVCQPCSCIKELHPRVAPLSGGLYLQGPLGLNTQVCQPCSCVKALHLCRTVLIRVL
jgi:hypothetical protein